MSTDFAGTVVGKFFSLSTLLSSSAENGLQHKQTSIQRLISPNPYLKTQGLESTIYDNIYGYIEKQTFELAEEKNAYLIKPKIAPELLEKIRKNINKTIHILKVDFDRLTYSDCNSSQTVEYDQSFLETDKKLKEELKVSPNKLFGSLNIIPVLADSASNEYINYKLFNYLAQGEIFAKEEPDLLVITGEMLWSTWLPEIALIKLIKDIFPEELHINVYVDYYGIWEIFAGLSAYKSELFNLNVDYFKPNLLCIPGKSYLERRYGNLVLELTSKENAKTLIVREDKNGIIDLGSSNYKLADIHLPRYLYIYTKNIQKYAHDINSYQKQWKNSQLYSQVGLVFNYTRINFPETLQRKFFYENVENKDLKVNMFINKGEYLGKVSHEEVHSLKIPINDQIAKNLRVVEGQIVKKGDIIYGKRGVSLLKQSKIVSPISGKVVLSDLDKGILHIIKQKHEDVLMPFNGSISLINRSEVAFEINLQQIPFDIFIGKSSSSTFSTMQRVRSVQKSIYYTRDLASIVKNINSLMDNSIVTIVVETADYKSLYTLLNSESFIYSNISLGIVNGYYLNNKDYKKIIRALEGKYVNVNNQGLFFPEEYLESKFSLSNRMKSNTEIAQTNIGGEAGYLSYEGEQLTGIIEYSDRQIYHLSVKDKKVTVSNKNLFFLD